MTKAGILDSEACGEHCYEFRKGYSCCCGVVTLIVVIILSVSWDTVAPTELGLLRNTITGSVDLENVYVSGRYFVGPAAEFIHFPAQQKILSYGNNSDRDRQRAIAARTGAAGTGDTDSGGQPLSLSVAFTYQLDTTRLPMVYATYGNNYESSYLRFAQEALTDVAQRFTPSEFWRNRRGIEMEMEKEVNQTISEVGFAHVRSLQLKSIGFQSSYETTITNIQLQEQLKVTKSFQLEVRRAKGWRPASDGGGKKCPASSACLARARRTLRARGSKHRPARPPPAIAPFPPPRFPFPPLPFPSPPSLPGDPP